jgi:hypothetical protein
MTATKKTTEELLAEMKREDEVHRSQGIVCFDGSPAWAEFCKQMGDAAVNGALVDDFDDE